MRGIAGLVCCLMLAAAAPGGALCVAVPPAGDQGGAIGRRVVASYAHDSGQTVRIGSWPAPGWDVALIDPVALDAACGAGAGRIDWARVGGRGRFLPFATSDCGVGAYLRATVLTWDTARTHAPPVWADFWNVARMPGQRGLPHSPMMTLEIALMADGVAPRDVYSVLRTADGPDRAFRKLDQLRPYIVWWRAGDDPMALVASGKVLMGVAPSDRVVAASRRLHRVFGLQWAGAVDSVQSWAVSAATTRGAAAAALMTFASDPGRQSKLLGSTGLGGTLVAAPGAAATSPSAHADAGVPFDAGFWRAHGAALTARFNQWLAH